MGKVCAAFSKPITWSSRRSSGPFPSGLAVSESECTFWPQKHTPWSTYKPARESLERGSSRLATMVHPSVLQVLTSGGAACMQIGRHNHVSYYITISM